MNGNYGNCEGILIRKIRGQRERVEGMEERRPSGFDFGGSGIVGVWEGDDGESDVRLWEFETDSAGNWGNWVEIIGGW